MKTNRPLILIACLGCALVSMAQNGAETTDTVMHLKEAVIHGRKLGTTLNTNSLLKTETINTAGFQKMACCSLGESFENSATATVQYSDAVTGTKEIQLLGLAGRYVQMLNENVTAMHGLAGAYGWNFIPSSWLESIQISKGAASVVNGYESVTGQINMEFRKPNNTDRVYADLYLDEQLHVEANAAASTQVTRNLWTGIMLHTTQTPHVPSLVDGHDRNGDGFMDMPENTNYNLYNRWLYINDERGVQSRFGIQYIHDDMMGGQEEDATSLHAGLPAYMTNVHNRQFNVWNKTGISVGRNRQNSIGIINSYTRNTLSVVPGMKTYDADEDYYTFNILFSATPSDKHKYTMGASMTWDRYAMTYSDTLFASPSSHSLLSLPSLHSSYSYSETVPGVFVEYTNTMMNALTLTVGLREDYNTRYGWLFTPRFNVKYDVAEWMTVRASAGKGYHSTQPLTENIGLMASSRQFDLSQMADIALERAWNFGGNLAFKIPVWNENRATLSADYYHTRFSQQTVVDMERSRHSVYFYNLNGGSSYSNVWQVDLSLPLFEGVEMFAAARFNNNYITYRNGGSEYTMERPLVNTFRSLINLQYASPLRFWTVNLTYQLNGRTRLPGMNGYFSAREYSPSYGVLFANVQREFRYFNVYAGCENILNYKQKNPIISSSTPYSPDFDASIIWGPIEGRRVYAGVRFKM